MLSEVKTIFTGSQVVARLGEVEPVIVERGLVADDLERAVQSRRSASVVARRHHQHYEP